MCSVHANSAREAVTKMCTLPLLAAQNVSSRFVVPTVAAVVDLVIHVALERDGIRRVREIVAVPGRAGGDVIEIADLFVTKHGRLGRADGFPPRRESFERTLRHGRLRRRMHDLAVGRRTRVSTGVFCIIYWSFWPTAARHSGGGCAG